MAAKVLSCCSMLVITSDAKRNSFPRVSGGSLFKTCQASGGGSSCNREYIGACATSRISTLSVSRTCTVPKKMAAMAEPVQEHLLSEPHHLHLIEVFWPTDHRKHLKHPVALPVLDPRIYSNWSSRKGERTSFPNIICNLITFSQRAICVPEAPAHGL